MFVSKFHVFIALSLLVSEKTLAQDRVMIYPTIKLTYNNIQESSFLSSLQPQPFLIVSPQVLIGNQLLSCEAKGLCFVKELNNEFGLAHDWFQCYYAYDIHEKKGSIKRVNIDFKELQKIVANWSVKRARALALATSNKESQASKLEVMGNERCLRQETSMNLEVYLQEYIIMESKKRPKPILTNKLSTKGIN